MVLCCHSSEPTSLTVTYRIQSNRHELLSPLESLLPPSLLLPLLRPWLSLRLFLLFAIFLSPSLCLSRLRFLLPLSFSPFLRFLLLGFCSSFCRLCFFLCLLLLLPFLSDRSASRISCRRLSSGVCCSCMPGVLMAAVPEVPASAPLAALSRARRNASARPVQRTVLHNYV